jgi:hypothetical protein
MSIGAYLGAKVCDSPGRPGRNASDHVKVDCPVRGDPGNRDDSNAALEFQFVVGIVLSGGNAGDRQCYERYQQSPNDAPSGFASKGLLAAIVIHFASPYFLSFYLESQGGANNGPPQSQSPHP